MSLYTFKLKAGKPFHRVVAGRMILVDSTGEAEHIHITAMRGSQEVSVLPERQKAFKCWIEYDNIVLQASVDCTVRLFLSMTDVSLGFADGALVNVRGGVSIENDPNHRIPVDIGGGSVNLTAENVGINNDDAKAVPVRAQSLKELVHLQPVIVNNGLAQTLVSDPTLRKLRILNASQSAAVALGGVGVTMANAAIILEPGDAWLEDDAAGAAWFAVSDSVGANVRVMGVK